MPLRHKFGVWFPAVRAGSGTDVFTKRLAEGLRQRGIPAEVTWLPRRAEYAPWTVKVPQPPAWANIVHVNTWLHPRFLPGNLPVVATIHHAAHHPALRPYKRGLQSLYHERWIKSVEQRVLRRADRAVAVSEFAAVTARATLSDRPMEVIYNGVDTARYHPPKFHQKRQFFRLLYVGKWSSLKGADLLAPIMLELGARYELQCVGPSPPTGPGRMSANMRILGCSQGEDAIIAAMQGADALLFPSRMEGFGLVVAEAMACGLPVIATNGSALPELVKDGVTGILCEPDNVAEFAYAAKKLADDAELRSRMAKAARQRAVELFSLQRMVDAYVGIYEDLAGE